MNHVHFDLHNFEKVNLITRRDRNGSYDLYKCTACQLEGKRRELGSNFLEVATNRPCTKPRPTTITIAEDREKDVKQFGFTAGQVLDVVECPKHYLHMHANEVWVFSEKRNEPVRLLPGEYK